MLSIEGLAVAAVLVAAIGMAKADVYSYTTPVSGVTNDSTDSTYFFPASFNSGLGQLTGVGLTFTGTLNVSDLIVVTPEGQPPQPGIYFQTNASVVGDGISPQNPNGLDLNIGTEPGVIGAQYVTAQGQVTASFAVAAQAVADYAGNGSLNSNLDGFVEFNSFPYMQNGNYYTYQTFPNTPQAIFTGALIETFTYQPAGVAKSGTGQQPASVPEPGSLALLGTAGIMLAGARKLTRRRRTL